MPLQSYCLTDQLNQTSFWGFASSGDNPLKADALYKAAKFCGLLIKQCNPRTVMTSVDLCSIYLEETGQTSNGRLNLFDTLYTESVEALCMKSQYCIERLSKTHKENMITLAITLGSCAVFLGLCFVCQLISSRRHRTTTQQYIYPHPLTVDTALAAPSENNADEATIATQGENEDGIYPANDENTGLLSQSHNSYNTANP